MSDNSESVQEFWRYASALAIASGLFILFMSLVFLVFAGNMTRLTCRKIPMHPIDCSLQNTWVGLFTIAEQAIKDIKRADIGEHCDEDGDCTYRLELMSGHSNRLPLTPFYSAGRAEKQLAQAEINTFLEQSDQMELAILIAGSSGQIASIVLSILAGIGGCGLIAFGIRTRRKHL